jgi:hypothetical protein
MYLIFGKGSFGNLIFFFEEVKTKTNAYSARLPKIKNKSKNHDHQN